MKIAYCIYDYTAGGGTERILSRKCNALVEMGYDIYIINICQFPRQCTFPFSKSLKVFNLSIAHHKVREYNIIFKLLLDPLFYIWTKKKLSSVLEEIQPDILISTFGREAKIIPSIKLPCKKILEFHHNRGYKLVELEHRKISDFQKKIIRYNYRKELKLIKRYDRFVVLTEEDRQSWGYPPNCVVIPNMNSFSSAFTASLEPKQVLALGRLTYQKGFDLLIQVWEIVVKTLPGWHLNISGEGEERDNLLKLIAEKGLQTHISVLPYTNNIIDRLMEHSIFVLSSRHEGFGLALTEAMECGIPCISFRCKSGPSEIITDEEDGFLINEGDLGGMADRIIELALNPDKRKAMGIKAKFNVKRFSITTILTKWKSLFHNLL